MDPETYKKIAEGKATLQESDQATEDEPGM